MLSVLKKIKISFQMLREVGKSVLNKILILEEVENVLEKVKERKCIFGILPIECAELINDG